MKIVLLLLISLCAFTLAALPGGIQASLTAKGLNYAGAEAIAVFADKIKAVKIPDASGSEHISVIGTVDWTVSAIQIVQLSLPGSTIATAGDQVVISLNNVAIALTCNFHYRKAHWPHVSGSGTADISITSSSIVIKFGITDNNGQPHVQASAVNVNFNSVDVKVHGHESWLYNLLLKLFKGDIKNSIQNQVTGAVTDVINNQLNQFLDQIPLYHAIGTWGKIDYSLADAPVIDGNGVSVPLKGVIESVAGAVPPIQPSQKLPSYAVSSNMIEVFVGDYPLNTGLYTLYKSGLMDFTVTDADIPSSIPFHFNTNSFQFIIPELYMKYPNTTMEAKLSPDQSFTADFNATTGVHIQGTYDAQFSVLPASGPVPVFTLSVGVNTDVEASLANNTVVGKLETMTVTVSLKSSTVGTFDPSIIQTLLNTAISSVGIPYLNILFSKNPVPFPVIPNYQIGNVTLVYNNGYVMVALDVHYSG